MQYYISLGLIIGLLIYNLILANKEVKYCKGQMFFLFDELKALQSENRALKQKYEGLSPERIAYLKQRAIDLRNEDAARVFNDGFTD